MKESGQQITTTIVAAKAVGMNDWEGKVTNNTESNQAIQEAHVVLKNSFVFCLAPPLSPGGVPGEGPDSYLTPESKVLGRFRDPGG